MSENRKITSDIYLAAALLSLGAVLETTNKSNPRHMEFEFRLPDATETTKPDEDFFNIVETEWTNQILNVNAFDFSESLKRLKSVVHTS